MVIFEPYSCYFVIESAICLMTSIHHDDCLSKFWVIGEESSLRPKKHARSPVLLWQPTPQGVFFHPQGGTLSRRFALQLAGH